MKKAIWGLTILMLSNFVSMYYVLYLKFWWFDVVQHFLGGFFVAMLFADYLEDHFIPNKKLNNLLIIVGATMFIGVTWEFAEYVANQTLIEPFRHYFGVNAYFMGDLKDTMGDLLNDMLGAITLYGLHSFWSRKPHEVKTNLENSGNTSA